MASIIAKVEDVVWSKFKTKHVIQYHLHRAEFKGYDADVKAAHEFGECVLHQSDINNAITAK